MFSTAVVVKITYRNSFVTDVWVVTVTVHLFNMSVLF